MFCRWCGCKLYEGAEFCHSCGRKQSDGSVIETIQPVVPVSVQANAPVNSTVGDDSRYIMPLTILCLLMSIIGVITFFLPYVYIDAYDSYGYAFSVDYSGIYLGIGFDFSPEGPFYDFSMLGRVIPSLITIAYVFLAVLFFRGFKYRLSAYILITGIIIFILGIVEGTTFVSFPLSFEGFDIYPYTGYGLSIATFLTIPILILAYFAEQEMAKAGWENDPLF